MRVNQLLFPVLTTDSIHSALVRSRNLEYFANQRLFNQSKKKKKQVKRQKFLTEDYHGLIKISGNLTSDLTAFEKTGHKSA